MKATLDCLECVARQALRAARIATDDPDTQRRILNETLARIPRMDLDDSPAALSMAAYQLAAAHSGKTDPYAELKRAQNAVALSLEAKMRDRVRESDDPLVTALHLAAAGNVIDGQYLLLLAVMAIIGGYVGAALAYRISQPLLRGFIVIVGLAMALGFFMR